MCYSCIQISLGNEKKPSLSSKGDRAQTLIPLCVLLTAELLIPPITSPHESLLITLLLRFNNQNYFRLSLKIYLFRPWFSSLFLGNFQLSVSQFVFFKHGRKHTLPKTEIMPWKRELAEHLESKLNFGVGVGEGIVPSKTGRDAI